MALPETHVTKWTQPHNYIWNKPNLMDNSKATQWRYQCVCVCVHTITVMSEYVCHYWGIVVQYPGHDFLSVISPNFALWPAPPSIEWEYVIHYGNDLTLLSLPFCLTWPFQEQIGGFVLVWSGMFSVFWQFCWNKKKASLLRTSFMAWSGIEIYLCLTLQISHKACVKRGSEPVLTQCSTETQIQPDEPASHRNSKDVFKVPFTLYTLVPFLK